RKALVPATAVRRPDGVGNRRPRWIGTGGRHQSECPADIVGLVGKNGVDRFDPASDKRAHRIGVGINQAFRRLSRSPSTDGGRNGEFQGIFYSPCVNAHQAVRSMTPSWLVFKKGTQFARTFWDDTSGIILPYVTMMLVVIVGLSVLAVDGARLMSLQTQ